MTYIPDRLTEGYGPSEEALRGLAQEGARLILTVDCGTTAGSAIDAANAEGAEVIVIDHHQADEALPRALAVAEPEPSGRSFWSGASRRRWGRVPVPGGDHPRSEARGLLSRSRRARPARPARPRCARHGMRRGAAQGARTALSSPRGSRCCGSGTMPACARSPMSRASIRRRPPIRSASSWARASTLADASALPASARSCSPQTTTSRRARSPRGSKLLNAERKAIEERMLEEAFARAEATLAASPKSPLLFLGAEGWHKGLARTDRGPHRRSFPSAVFRCGARA